MNILDTEQLEVAFKRLHIDDCHVARKFYADIWQTIKDAENIHDAGMRIPLEKKLKSLCHDYFQKMAWWYEGKAKNSDISLSNQLAKEAQNILPQFEKQFFRYTLCYMELNRALLYSKDQIKIFAKNYNIKDADQSLNVDHGTEMLLHKAQKHRKELQEKRRNLETLKPVFLELDPLMEILGKKMPRLFGGEGGRMLTRFKASLRQGKFTQVEDELPEWKKKTLMDVGKKIIALTRKNAEILRAQDRLILHSGEMTLIYAFLERDEERIAEFLEKFDVPYMVFQYKNLIHQGYLLGQIGSIEGLLIHHAKLMSLIAHPADDADYAKTQEQKVIIPARILMQSKFKSLGGIFDSMETTQETLNRLFAGTRDYMAAKSLYLGKDKTNTANL